MQCAYFFILLTTMICLFGCGSKKEVTSLRFSGTLEITEHVLGAKVPGRVATISVEEGSPVQKGQVLAVLDRFDQAQKDYERSQALLTVGGMEQQSVEYAALAVEDQKITAPVDGVVLIKVRQSGEIVPAAGAVVVVGDTSRQWVRVFVPQGSINQLRLGQGALLVFDGLSTSFHGTVGYIAPTAEFTPRNVQTPEERVTQAFAVKVYLDKADPLLHPGVGADVTFEK